MKYVFLLLFSISFGATNYAQQNDSFSIVGLWDIDDKDEEGSMRLDSLGFFYFISEDLTFGGDSFKLDGSLASMKYRVVDSTSPKQIIISVINWDENKTKYLRGVFTFIDANTLKMHINTEDEIQPTQFDEDDSPLFKRKTN